MTSRRDLGPLLAAAGGAVVLGAVVTGFIVVGGPGDARVRRLDDRTMQKVSSIANIAQCIYSRSGAPPQTLEEIAKAAALTPRPDPDNKCLYVQPGDIEDLQDIEYKSTDGSRIAICAKFNRPTDKRDGGQLRGWNAQFPALGEERPEAGRHCFDIDLEN